MFFTFALYLFVLLLKFASHIISDTPAMALVPGGPCRDVLERRLERMFASPAPASVAAERSAAAAERAAAAAAAAAAARVEDEPEEPSCTPALAPSALALKYGSRAAKTIGGGGGLWQTAARADLSSPARVYVSGLLAPANNNAREDDTARGVDPHLQQLNHALRTDGARSVPPSPATTFARAKQPVYSAAAPLPSLPGAAASLSLPTLLGVSADVGQRVQQLLDAYAAQCAERRQLMEEKQRELKNWYHSEVHDVI